MIKLNFINTNLYNIDAFLLNPQYLAYYPDVSPIKQYYDVYKGMCHTDPGILLNKEHININGNTITVTFTLTRNNLIDNIFNTKWCIIYDDLSAPYPDQMFFICKINSLTRTDIKSYRMVCTIDPVRSFPMNNRVFKLFDQYNGDTVNADLNYPLDYPLATQDVYGLSGLDRIDYVVCAVFLNDPEYNEYKFTRLKSINELDRTDGIFSSSYVVAFGKKQYILKNITERTEDGLELTDTVIEADNNQLTDMFYLVSLRESIDSFKEFYNRINSKGTGSSSPITNIIGCFIVPVNALDNLDNKHLMAESYIVADDNRWYGERKKLTSNVQCARPSHAEYYDDDINIDSSIRDNMVVAFGKYVSFKPMAINYSDININNKLKNYYGDNLANCNNLVNIELSTCDDKIEIPLNVMQNKTLFCQPYFTGGKISYYIALKEYDNVKNEYIETLPNYRINGSFVSIPLISNGITRFDNNEGVALRTKMLSSGLNLIPSAGYASFQGNIGSVTQGTKTTMMSGHSISGAFTPLQLIGGLANFASNMSELGIANKAGVSKGNTIEDFPTSVASLLSGLCRIQLTTVRPEILDILNSEVDYYGIKSVDTDGIVNLTNKSSYYSVKYHKSIGGTFSSPELEEIFNNGVFVCVIDLSDTQTALTTIRNILTEGVSGYNV